MATTFNDNIQVNAPKPVDNKIGVFSGGSFRPYNSVAEANTTINQAYRYKGLEVLINVSGSAVPYSYKNGILDTDLVQLAPPTSGTSDSLNVVDFGADPTGTNPSSTAINAAITAASTLGKPVFIPAGTFKIDATINYNEKVDIRGAGRLSTILKASAAVPMIQKLNTGTILQLGANISDLQLHGNGIGTIGINIRGVFAYNVIRCYIHDVTQIGAQLLGLVGGNFETTTFVNCSRAIKSDEVTQTTSDYVPGNWVKFNNCGFYSNSQWAMDWRTGAMLAITDSDFEENGTANNVNTGCIHMYEHAGADEGVGLIINTTWFERNAGTIVLIDAPRGVTSHRIESCLLQYPEGGGTSRGVVVKGTAGIKQTLTLVNSKVVGQTTDVLADGANTFIHAEGSDIGVNSTANGGVVNLSAGGAWTVVDANNIEFSGPSHTIAKVYSRDTSEFSGTAAGFEAESGIGNKIRMQANYNEVFVASTGAFPFSLYSQGVKRLEMPTAGGIRINNLSGTGVRGVNVDSTGLLVEGSAAINPFVSENSGNTLHFTAPANHAIVIAEGTAGSNTGAFEAKAAAGTRLRIQANATLAFLGTLTATPLQLIANNTARVEMPSAGGIILSELTGGSDGVVGIHSDGSLYKTTVGVSPFSITDANNIAYTSGTTHALVTINGSAVGNSAGIQLNSPSGAGLRLQANASETLLGTSTNHDLTLSSNGTVGLRLTFTSGTIVPTNDLVIGTIGKGVVIKSPDGTSYRITVADGGAISATAI